MDRDGSSGVNFWPHSIADEDKAADPPSRARGIPVESVGRHYVLISVPRRGLLRKTKIQADCARVLWHYLR